MLNLSVICHIISLVHQNCHAAVPPSTILSRAFVPAKRGDVRIDVGGGAKVQQYDSCSIV